MSEIQVTPKWITDEEGNKIAPKTLASQVYDKDGDTLFNALKFNKDDETIIPDKDYLKDTDVIDNLTSTDTDKPLSANMGKVLNDKFEDVYRLTQTTFEATTSFVGTVILTKPHPRAQLIKVHCSDGNYWCRIYDNSNIGVASYSFVNADNLTFTFYADWLVPIS